MIIEADYTLAIVNNTTVKTGMQASLWNDGFINFGFIPRSELDRCYIVMGFFLFIVFLVSFVIGGVGTSLGSFPSWREHSLHSHQEHKYSSFSFFHPRVFRAQ